MFIFVFGLRWKKSCKVLLLKAEEESVLFYCYYCLAHAVVTDVVEAE